LSLIERFEEAATAQVKPEPAAKARSLGAELAWMSYERFKESPDVKKTLDLARRVIRNCPRCEAAPLAQVLIGRALIAENRLDEAYRELLKVELNFPRSSERATARALMTSLRAGRTPPPSPDVARGDKPPANSLSSPGSSSPKTPNPPISPPDSVKPPDKPPVTPSVTPPVKPSVKTVKVTHPKTPKGRSDGMPQVYGLNLVDYGDYEEIIAYIDQVTPYLYNLLPPTPGGRFRVYADFKGAKLYPQIKERLNKSTDLVKLVKVSQLNADTVRLVADLPGPWAYRPLFLDNPNRLVIQVAQEASDLPGPEPEVPPSPPVKKEPKATTPVKPARGPASSLARQLGLKIRKVVIDPGHGGKDTGASGHGVKEKDVALKVGLLLAEKIRSRLGLTVILTRDADKFVTLDRRSRITRESQGDLFISIHVNANSLAKVEGFETYILNFTDNPAALETAARENAVSDKSMSEMFNILELIAKNTRVAESRVLAKSLHANALTSMRSKYKVRDLGVKEAVFLVLVNMNVPAALLEIGFVTNAADAARLTQEEYLDLMTDGLVVGLKAYIAGLPK
jgi:N-acetylmuramoyl-L-alanine amidase